jgi:hypothetical protein
LHFKFSFVLGVGKVISLQPLSISFNKLESDFLLNWSISTSTDFSHSWAIWPPFLAVSPLVFFLCCSVVSNQTSWWIIFHGQKFATCASTCAPKSKKYGCWIS